MGIVRGSCENRVRTRKNLENLGKTGFFQSFFCSHTILTQFSHNSHTILTRFSHGSHTRLTNNLLFPVLCGPVWESCENCVRIVGESCENKEKS